VLADDGGVERLVGQVSPKNNSWRTWMLVVLPAGPGLISTVAGSNGTAVFTDPRVATAAHEDTAWLVTNKGVLPGGGAE
jgi:hypothetical protein